MVWQKQLLIISNNQFLNKTFLRSNLFLIFITSVFDFKYYKNSEKVKLQRKKITKGEGAKR